jgi:hypothetical protein
LRIATDLSTATVTITCCDCFGLSASAVTSPTRRPLNITALPVRSPLTEPSKAIL